MAEVSDQAPDRRASWVALRTLRQRPPAAVGRTDAGETIYEVRSVRAVLPAGAAHFHRLVRCTKCDREVPGPPLVTPADLDHPANPMFCERCGRAPLPAATPAPARPERKEAERPPVLGPPSVAKAPAPAPTRAPVPAAARPVDPAQLARLADLEARVSDVVARLAATAPVEKELRLLSNRVAGVLDDHQSELGKLSASLTEARSGIWELAESNRELGRLQGELNQRVVELAERVAAPPTPTVDPDPASNPAALVEELGTMRTALAGLQQRILDQEAALTGLLERRQQETGDALRSEIAMLEQRTREESAGLAGLVETRRQEMERAVEETGRLVIQALSEPLRDLGHANEETAARLSRLEQMEPEVAALKDWPEAASSRMQAIEDELGALATAVAEIRSQVGQVADSNQGLIQSQIQRDEQVSELAERLGAMVANLAAIDAAPAEADAGSRTELAAPGVPDLVKALERQLLAAGGRLSLLNDGPPLSPEPEG